MSKFKRSIIWFAALALSMATATMGQNDQKGPKEVQAKDTQMEASEQSQTDSGQGSADHPVRTRCQPNIVRGVC